MFLRLSILCSLSWLTLTGRAQTEKIEPSCPSVFTIHKDGGNQSIRYASSHSLNKVDTGVTTLLVYIHGLHRNALGYFGYAEDLVRSVKRKKETLLIAPQYADEEDLDYYHLNNDYLFWRKAEWKDGHTSISSDRRSQPIRMSSYEVLDSLLNDILTGNNFPHIKMVVVVGHSAGGQFVQRYSAITPLPDLLQTRSFRFIVMDPSSYMYPDGRRPLGDGSYGLPDTVGCPGYNHYPKGLLDLNTYAKATGAGKILYNLLHRDIVILLGRQDTRMDDPNLDVSCAANLQGDYRLVRGLQYIAFIETFPGYSHKDNYGVVPDSGHDGDLMINSSLAKKWIFGIVF